jgi:hypothetical protein
VCDSLIEGEAGGKGREESTTAKEEKEGICEERGTGRTTKERGHHER